MKKQQATMELYKKAGKISVFFGIPAARGKMEKFYHERGEQIWRRKSQFRPRPAIMSRT